jgi:DNA polymerase-1
MPDWRNRSGEATAGVYGFLSMLQRAIEELNPTHLAIVFDTPQPTFRHNMYVGYQVTREKDRQVSEDIWGQVEKLRLVFEKMGVGVFSVPGFEADDVIGTIAKKAKIESVIVITGDRDLMQLVDEKIHLYMPQKGLSDGVEVDRDKVRERLGVWPEQVIEYKALVGDSSDNYPGVAGIGPKTAVKLLEEYKTFEEVVKKSGNQKVIDGYEGGELSKRLATINIETPVTFKLDDLKIPSEEVRVKVLKELGYKSLIRRMTGQEVTIDDSQGKLFE